MIKYKVEVFIMANEVLFLTGILKERIWGSNYFKDTLQVTNLDNRFGEYWSLSAHPEGESIITSGDFKGWKLSEVYLKHPELFGKHVEEFPILIKIIATSDKLSVQVHPNDEYARTYENQKGKTEGWLILKANESSQIVLGHRAKDKDELIKLINNKEFDKLLKYEKAKKGMFIPVTSGVIHAIGKDIVLLEVQQSSDVTYRLYDYDRLDFNGKLRDLHIQKAIDVITYENQLISNHNYLDDFKKVNLLWKNKYFNVYLYQINQEYKFIPNNNQYYLGTVIEGSILVNNHLVKMGDSFIITTQASLVSFKGMGKISITSVNH